MGRAKDEIKEKLRRVEETQRTLEKIFKMMKTIKMNSLHSEKEFAKDMMIFNVKIRDARNDMQRYEELKNEKEIMMRAWKVRMELSKKMQEELKALIDEIAKKEGIDL